MKHSIKTLFLLILIPFNVKTSDAIEKLTKERNASSHNAEQALNLLKNLHTELNRLKKEYQDLITLDTQDLQLPASPSNVCFPLRPKNIPSITNNSFASCITSETIERNNLLRAAKDFFITLLNSQIRPYEKIYKTEQKKAYTFNEEIEALLFKIAQEEKMAQIRNARH